jgi:threonine dehydrogenase-like Zn-dependent dehydrogenase
MTISHAGPGRPSERALAAVLVAPRQLELRDLPIPLIGPDDALLRVEACGLCGTDYEQWQGHVVNWGDRMPLIPGHEPIGWIESIGKQASSRWRVKEGDRIAVEPVIPCGHCPQCVVGAYTRCESDEGYGFFNGLSIPPALWGGYASHLYLHPRAMVHRLPDNIPTDLMTLFNPLSNAVRWVYEAGGVGLGTSVVIEGPGQRGLLAVVVAREAGAKKIIVTGTSADRERLATALKLGASATIDVTVENSVERVRELTDGQLADVVLEVAAGSPQTIVDAVDMVKRGGRVVLAGLKGKRPVEGLFSDKIVFREIQLIGVLSAGWRSIELAIDIIRRRADNLGILCSHSFPLPKAEEAVRMLGREISDGTEVMHVTLDVAGKSSVAPSIN